MPDERLSIATPSLDNNDILHCGGHILQPNIKEYLYEIIDGNLISNINESPCYV